MPETSYFFDAVTLSNFALADAVDVLNSRYDGRLMITEEVFDEIIAGVVDGYTELRRILDLAESKSFLPVQLDLSERHLYIELVDNLGRGEASCIVAAYERKGIVVTDDSAAREHCFDREIPCTGTIGILKAMCLDGELAVSTADDLLISMVESGFYSPVRRIRDIL